MAPLAEVFDVGIRLAADLGSFRRDTERGVGDAAEQAAETGGQRFKRRFSAVANAAGLAIGGALAFGIAEGLAQSDANKMLAAQLGATPAQAAKLGKLSGQLYASGFGSSMEDVNAALRGVVQNGIAGLDQTEDAIKAAAANVTNLAALLGEDAGRVSAAVSQMLRTGLAKSSEEAFDLLVAATQKGINKSEDLLDTMNEYGTVLREIGLTGDQALGLLGQALSAGARDADTAADALKEFSIRAQDGSKLSAEAFAALGINADKAFAAVAAGGPGSTAILDQVLDKLRAMPANAERTALAVALFGTKAEDLGDALFAMNLDTASQQLGGFQGAAQRAGDTMASSANAQVDTFVRRLKQDLVEAVAGAIPKLEAFGRVLNDWHDVIVPLGIAIGTLGAVIWTVNAAMTAWATITTVANALGLVSIARVVASTVANAAYTVGAYAVIAATGAWMAAQWLLNAALAFAMSPIGLIVIAIAALVAIVVIAWKNSETFRSIVLASWEAIKTASLFLWESVLKPIFSAWWSFAQMMGQVYLWLWHNVIEPAMQGIGLVIQVVWVGIQIVFQLWRYWIMEVVVPAVMFLWEKAVKPVMDLIVAYLQFAWAAIKIVWDLLVGYIRNVVVPAYSFLWDMVKVIWNGIAGTISWVWTNAIKPVFDVIVKFITQDVPAAWRRGVDLIGFWWNALKDLAKAPVRFVIETVVNKGIIGTFNWIADHLPGINKIKPIDLPSGFAAGGMVTGPGGPRDDKIAAMLSNGEYVIPARTVSKLGVRFFDRLIGRPTGVDKPGDGSEGLAFADGGLVGLIKDPAGWVRDRVNLDAIPGSGLFSQVGRAMGSKLVGGLVNFAKEKVKQLIGFGGSGVVSGIAPGNIGQIQAWLLGQHGKPYVWASAGPYGYDCSGIVSAVWNLMHGRQPYNHTFSTHSQAAYFPQVGRWGPLTAGWANAGEKGGGRVGHTAGNLAGMAFESTGSRGVRVNVPGISSVTSFAHFGTFDGGGPLPHRGIGVNLSGQTEQVTPAPTMLTVVEELRLLRAAVERVAPGVGREIAGANAAGVAAARTF